MAKGVMCTVADVAVTYHFIYTYTALLNHCKMATEAWQSRISKIKCKLEQHSQIPPQVLYILTGRMPPISKKIFEHDIEDSEREVSADSWEEDWEEWEDGSETSRVSKQPSSAVRVTDKITTIATTTTEHYLISSSGDGTYFVLAHDRKFVVLKHHIVEGQFTLAGQGTGDEEDGEIITSILCLPLFLPSSKKNQIFVMVGYSTGCIRVFTETGVLLMSQLLHNTRVIQIKLRTPPAAIKPSELLSNAREDDEEITILFDGHKIVNIEGQSFWTALKLCGGQEGTDPTVTNEQMTFNYKKWALDSQEKIFDVVSCGPSISAPSLSSSVGYSTSLSTIPFAKPATTRFLGVGTNPMICYYGISETSRPMSAGAIASLVVSKVTSAVFSYAKSWWDRDTPNNSQPSSGPSSRPGTPTPGSKDSQLVATQQIAPAITIPPVLKLDDPNRNITHIWLSPPASSSSNHILAATSDSLGRVMMLDVEEGEIIRIWKGFRDVTCGWLEVLESDVMQNEIYASESSILSRRTLLFLVIYSPRRSLLEIYPARYGPRIGIFHLPGTGWNLVQCAGQALGSTMVGRERWKRAMSERGSEKSGLAQVYLIGPSGEVYKLKIIATQ